MSSNKRRQFRSSENCKDYSLFIIEPKFLYILALMLKQKMATYIIFFLFSTGHSMIHNTESEGYPFCNWSRDSLLTHAACQLLVSCEKRNHELSLTFLLSFLVNEVHWAYKISGVKKLYLMFP